MHEGAMTETSPRQKSSSLNNRESLLGREFALKPARNESTSFFSPKRLFVSNDIFNYLWNWWEWSLVKNCTLSSGFTPASACHVQLEVMGRNYSVLKPISDSKSTDKLGVALLILVVVFFTRHASSMANRQVRSWLGYRLHQHAPFSTYL